MSLRRMSAVAVDSAWAIAPGATTCTWVADVSPRTPPLSSMATSWPRLAPVASRTRMRATSADASERFAIQAGRNMSAPKKIGPKTVATRNHLVRTRSMYSRSRTTRSFFMTNTGSGNQSGGRKGHRVAHQCFREHDLVGVSFEWFRIVQRTFRQHLEIVFGQRRRSHVFFDRRIHSPGHRGNATQHHADRAVTSPCDRDRNEGKVPRAALENLRVALE